MKTSYLNKAPYLSKKEYKDLLDTKFLSSLGPPGFFSFDQKLPRQIPYYSRYRYSKKSDALSIALLQVMGSDNIELFKKMISRGLPLDTTFKISVCPDIEPYNLLQMSLVGYRGNHITSYLFSLGLSKDVLDSSGNNLLFVASGNLAFNSNPNLLNLLLEQGLPVNSLNYLNWNLFHSIGNLPPEYFNKALDTLFKYGFSPEKIHGSAHTFFHMREENIKLLIERADTETELNLLITDLRLPASVSPAALVKYEETTTNMIAYAQSLIDKMRIEKELSKSTRDTVNRKPQQVSKI